MKRVFLATALSAAFAMGTSLVLAQSAEPVAATIVAAAPAGEADTQRATPQRRAFRSATERVEARLAYIHTALKITDAQRAQWDNFANVLRKHAQDIDARIQQRRAQATPGADPRAVSAIERLERAQKRTAERYHRMGEVITAAKPLYDVLSPEQKQVADSMLARGAGGHRHHHRGGHTRGA